MAFVVVAHPADDITTDEFAAGVAKVDRMRQAVPGAFRVATEGFGRLETSNKVFVVQNDTWSRPKANPAWQDLYGRVRWTLKDVYEETGDVWDFVAIYMADDRGDSFGGNAALIQSEDASMTGLAAYDHTRRVGSDGRLLCVGLINKVCFFVILVIIPHLLLTSYFHSTLATLVQLTTISALGLMPVPAPAFPARRRSVSPPLYAFGLSRQGTSQAHSQYGPLAP